MNKEFIPYEQALEFKDFSFYEKCIAFYNTNKELVIGLFPSNSDINAPLYSQAFTYFIMTRGLFSNIIIHDDKKFSYTITYFTNGTRVDMPIQKKFEKYQEAKLACLKELTEMVKKENEENKEYEDQFGLFLEGKQTREEWKSKFPQHFPK
jgi:hypothetical protein